MLGVLNEMNVTMLEDTERTWHPSFILPFLGNIVLEHLECNATAQKRPPLRARNCQRHTAPPARLRERAQQLVCAYIDGARVCPCLMFLRADRLQSA